jgi:hypothetical protein
VDSRKFYLDTQTRTFVASAESTFAASAPLFYGEDVEAVELFFLSPTGDAQRPYNYLDYSSNTVKFAIGTTTPAAYQASWSAISSTVTASVTSLVTGGSGSNEQQRITLSPKPASGGWAVQLPERNVTVSSVSTNIFTAADHGLYDGQSVSLTAFSFTSSAVANGASYFVIRNSKDTFSLASTATSSTALTAAVTSGGGTVTLPAVTTGQLAHDADPSDVQGALVSAGLTINTAPQILVTGSPGTEYVLTFANGSANRDYDNVSVVGSTLVGPVGLQGNVNFATNEIAALISAGTTGVKLEIEASDGTKRQTYQTDCTLSGDIVTSTSAAPLPTITPASSFNLIAPDTSTWTVTIDNDGTLSATKQ